MARSPKPNMAPQWFLWTFVLPWYFWRLSFVNIYLSLFWALGAIYSAVIHTARSTQSARGYIDLTREGIGLRPQRSPSGARNAYGVMPCHNHRFDNASHHPHSLNEFR